MNNFFVKRRNSGHWDISTTQGRLFAIRGGPGRYYVRDSRPVSKNTCSFKTIGSAMSYITDELMFETIVVDGTQPTIIESYHV